jgi:hypothetical protein
MRKRYVIAAVSVLVLTLSSTRISWAIFGIVFDPTVAAKVGVEIAQVKTIVSQVTQSYALAKHMSEAFTKMPSYYKSLLTSQISKLRPSTACVNCGVWTEASNLGGFAGGDPTYGGVVSKLGDVSKAMGGMDPTAVQRFQSELAHSFYLRQASVDQDLATLGNARASDSNMQEYVRQCQNSVMDSSLVTQVEVAQSGNACTTVIAQGQTTTNALLARIVENHSIETARQMDQEARRVDEISAMQDVPPTGGVNGMFDGFLPGSEDGE